MAGKVYSVSDINGYIKSWFAQNGTLSSVCVTGEISNYKLYPSGHHYFSLKDDNSSLSCVMFRGNAASLRFRPSNGMKVLAAGKISVFERDGKYQLQCDYMMPAGEGDLKIAFEKLKASLEAEGLFNQSHKKPLPTFPSKIAVITSPVGAAIRDVLRILGERWPMAEVVVVPARVQGAEAAEEISAAIRYVNEHVPADLIITGRGGGSAEDLWCFNDENLARAIFHSEIPVISAVGHEPDVTISDYVADKRAATPSNAAEIAVPDCADVRNSLDLIGNRIAARANNIVTSAKNEFMLCSSARMMHDPSEIFNFRRMVLDSIRDSILRSESEMIFQRKQQLIRASSSIEAMSPLKVLTRGYSYVSDCFGKTVKSVTELSEGDRILLNFADGTAGCTVNSKELK